ncbi:amino acid decarboxylase [Lentzea sp. NBRC 105346]|uniref:pyridoxal phosphate-dependent decarboxylase family protein n=1 Tax=Lentzea sp. NBRC 105346 TaxID=3032205 RepID=UPI0024A03523|nr:pyridoxal-dependent decarboxylase [Lentzea sp. NBRC 105346]GLZ27832.1 amino acid decarboxylase [Lentzea sp. NBRC 105346]
MFTTHSPDNSPLTLEPDSFRDELVRAAHWAADYLQALPGTPVTTPMPDDHRRALSAPALPDDGRPVPEFLDFVASEVAPYPGGNGHPAFFAWITTPPAPAGIIAHLLGATLNASCGYGENALVELERGAVRALAELAGLPAATGGVLTSGGSMANLLCLAAARSWFLRIRGAVDGAAYDEAHARLVCYQSTETHMSVSKSARTIGLPASRIRAVPTTSDQRMDVAALRAAVEADLAAGLLPFCVVSSLGTTSTGAIDPIAEITAVCREFGMWHHGDGAYGGLGATHPALAPHYEGIAELDSLTIDPHKTLNTPIACGAALVTKPARLRETFTVEASYLEGNEEWPWLSDYTVELTRPGDRALAVHAVLHQLGKRGVTALIDGYLTHTEHLRRLVDEIPELELVAAGPWSITCLRYRPAGYDGDVEDLNARIAQEIQRRGAAFVATVRVQGELTLRVSICGHRTTKADIETLVAEILEAGRSVAATR